MRGVVLPGEVAVVGGDEVGGGAGKVSWVGGGRVFAGGFGASLGGGTLLKLGPGPLRDGVGERATCYRHIIGCWGGRTVAGVERRVWWPSVLRAQITPVGTAVRGRGTDDDFTGWDETPGSERRL